MKDKKLTLEDIEVINLDDPTPEETELHRAMADEIVLQRRAEDTEYERARSLLGKIVNVGSHKQRVAWMIEAGCVRVNVAGQSEPVDICVAPIKNVRARYIREVQALGKIIRDYNQKYKPR